MARPHRKSRAPTREQLQERFSTGGKDFRESLQSVLAGGRGEDSPSEDEREGDGEFLHVGKYMDDEETKERARRMFADPEFRADTARLRAEALAERKARDAPNEA